MFGTFVCVCVRVYVCVCACARTCASACVYTRVCPFVLRFISEILHTIGKQTRWLANGV